MIVFVAHLNANAEPSHVKCSIIMKDRFKMKKPGDDLTETLQKLNILLIIFFTPVFGFGILIIYQKQTNVKQALLEIFVIQVMLALFLLVSMV